MSAQDTVLESVREYRQRGWHPCAIPPEDGRPSKGSEKLGKGWPQRDYPDSAFEPLGTNVGLYLRKSGLICVDGDCEEAVRLAKIFCPSTGLIGGHDFRPMSHLFFRNTDLDRNRKYSLKGLGTIIELLVNQQVVVAPSVHPDGDQYNWEEFDEPAEIETVALTRSVEMVALGVALLTPWRCDGKHALSLCMAGAMKNTGWPQSAAEHFVEAIVKEAGHDKKCNCVASVRSTYQQTDKIVGIPKLREELADKARADFIITRIEAIGASYTEGTGGEQPCVDAELEPDPEPSEPQPDFTPPNAVWVGIFKVIADLVGEHSWRVWIAIYIALCAHIGRRLDLIYTNHSHIHAICFALLLDHTGRGKGLSTRLCRTILPAYFKVADGSGKVRGSPGSRSGLNRVLANYKRGTDHKVDQASVKTTPAICLIPEATTLFKSMFYGSHTHLVEGLNDLYDGIPVFTTDLSDSPRDGAGSLTIYKPELQILCTTTYADFAPFLPLGLTNGAFNRYLPLPGPGDDYEDLPEIDAQEVDAWQTLDGIIEKYVTLSDTGPLHGVPYAQPYTAEAWKCRKSWGHELKALYNEASTLRDLTSRVHLYSHQIAGVYGYAHQATASDPDKPITLECAEAAKAVCQTVIRHARLLLTGGDAPALTQGRQQDASDRGKVLQQIEKIRESKKGRTIKSIYNSVKGRNGQGLAFGVTSNILRELIAAEELGIIQNGVPVDKKTRWVKTVIYPTGVELPDGWIWEPK